MVWVRPQIRQHHTKNETGLVCKGRSAGPVTQGRRGAGLAARGIHTHVQLDDPQQRDEEQVKGDEEAERAPYGGDGGPSAVALGAERQVPRRPGSRGQERAALPLVVLQTSLHHSSNHSTACRTRGGQIKAGTGMAGLMERNLE